AVSRAFEVLSDAQRRLQYDRGESLPQPSPAPELGFAGFDFSAQVHVGRLDFREIIEGLSPAPASEGASSGEDLEEVARISFQESFHGTRRRVNVVRFDRCPSCAGVGEVDLGKRPCPACQGTGQVRASRGRMIFTRRCRECGGRGDLGRHRCARCSGEGRVMHSDWLEVTIPPGAGDGTRLRVPGAGNAGRRGGAAGDFVLRVQVEPHPFFHRAGDDLTCEVPVTVAEAALGAHVEVPTPDGAVHIEIPSGTQSGQRFRLRKRGLPLLSNGVQGRGDLWVEVKVVVPSVADDESRRLLAEFARRNPQDVRKDLKRFAGAKG
ncbi:MAG TPA: J domain-containing protein, partial [Vicinamibacteria bacterium]|nr:J domain-containing protein [Vicinamibacteria bacterium]